MKLVPLAVEIQRAAALEDRAYTGESQFDVVFPDGEETESVGEYEKAEESWKALNAKIADSGIKTYDGEKLGKFIEMTAERHDVTVSDLQRAAVREFEKFWAEYERWIEETTGEEEKPRAELRGSTVQQDQGTMTDVEIIDQFSRLHKTGLINWEKMHRDKMVTFSKDVQMAFLDKWKRVMGEDYISQAREEKEEKNEVQDRLVTCPSRNGDEMMVSFCENGCRDRKGCPAFDE